MVIYRFVGVVLLNFTDPALLLSIYSVACMIFSLGVTFGPGKSGVGCLFSLFFFESICYPVRLPPAMLRVKAGPDISVPTAY